MLLLLCNQIGTSPTYKLQGDPGIDLVVRVLQCLLVLRPDTSLTRANKMVAKKKDKGKNIRSLARLFHKVMMHNDAGCFHPLAPCINMYGFRINLFLSCRKSNM